MKLSIWLHREPISPDADSSEGLETVMDVAIRVPDELESDMRQLVLSLAQMVNDRLVSTSATAMVPAFKPGDFQGASPEP